ncbi:MAG TPA: polymer-forming cytoskeletal protein [Chitinophagaceae bacterium]|nr:polymer-forming cytoskeletal protein [Chitinophagaceae bacterium]
MFKKNNKQQPLQINDQQISTIIGEGYVFTGELQGSSVIRIEGKVIGNVSVDSGVILGENGIIEGNITSKSVIIYGTVHGNIKTTQLEIKRTGIINGEITTDTLEIELGAKYNGTLNMQQPQVLKEAS